MSMKSTIDHKCNLVKSGAKLRSRCNLAEARTMRKKKVSSIDIRPLQETIHTKEEARGPYCSLELQYDHNEVGNLRFDFSTFYSNRFASITRSECVT